MLTYKQRYRPRTTREYTKSDLTVYDSAGNTALNTLKVYGKSEVVDGAIKSAGEGYAVVDLGTLTWNYQSSTSRMVSSFFPDIKAPESRWRVPAIICPKYDTVYPEYTEGVSNDCCISVSMYGNIVIKDTKYTDPDIIKTALSGVILCYQQATPTTNTLAVKTDNGTGIDGTMAVFETGTPLRGIPGTTVRDVMTWDGSAGTVVNNCGEVRLADLTWSWWNQHPNVIYTDIADKQLGVCGMLCSAYPYNQNIAFSFSSEASLPDKTIYCSRNISSIFIKNTDYNTKEDFVASLGDAELVYELAAPTTQTLTQAENDSIAALRTFTPQTHIQNNASTDMTVNYTIKVPTIS